MEERIIDRLRRGEKIKCGVCNKDYYDNDFENAHVSNYFHCSNPDCKGSVHEQKIINIE